MSERAPARAFGGPACALSCVSCAVASRVLGGPNPTAPSASRNAAKPPAAGRAPQGPGLQLAPLTPLTCPRFRAPVFRARSHSFGGICEYPLHIGAYKRLWRRKRDAPSHIGSNEFAGGQHGQSACPLDRGNVALASQPQTASAVLSSVWQRCSKLLDGSGMLSGEIPSGLLSGKRCSSCDAARPRRDPINAQFVKDPAPPRTRGGAPPQNRCVRDHRI